MSFLSENGMEILLGAAFIVFAMSASRFITGVIKDRKNKLDVSGSAIKEKKDKQKKD